MRLSSVAGKSDKSSASLVTKQFQWCIAAPVLEEKSSGLQ